MRPKEYISPKLDRKCVRKHLREVGFDKSAIRSIMRADNKLNNNRINNSTK